MLLTSIYLLTLTSLTLASPLKSRRQPSAPCEQDCNEDGTNCPIGCPITPPNPTPTPMTCEQYCRTDDIDYSACISSCQIIDGVPQTRAPSVISPRILNQMEQVCEEECGGRKDYVVCMEPCEKYKNFAESQNSETMNNALTKRFFYLPYGEHELLYSLSDPTTHEDKIREEERLKEKNLSGRGSNAMKKRGYYQPTYKEAVKEAGLEGKKTGFKEEETVWDRFFRGENPFDKRSYNLPETEELGRKLSRRGIDAIRKRYYSWGADTAVEMESWQEKMRDALVSDPAAFGMDESQVEGFRKFKEISDSQKKGSERKLSRRGIDAIRKRGYFVGDWEASKEELRDLMLSHPEAFGMDKSQVEGLRKNKEKSEAKKEESERKLSERGSNAIRKRLFYWRSTYEKARDKVLSHPEAFDIDESDLEILRISKDINAQWKILEKEGKKEKGKDYGATIFGDGDSSAV